MFKVLLLLSALVLSFSLLAGERRTHSGKIIVGESSEYTYSNSSEAHRQSLRYALGMSGYLGLTRYSLFYYLSPDLALEVFSRETRDSLEDDGVDWDRRESAFGASVNFLTRDAWQFRLGFINRLARFTTERSSFDAARNSWYTAYDLRVSQLDYAVEGAIGTQWQWSSFFFGLDWINYEYRLATLHASTSLLIKDRDRTRFDPTQSALEKARVTDNGLNRKKLYMSARIGWAF